MLRLFILALLGAVIHASLIPNHFLDYPRSLQSLFGVKREIAEEGTQNRPVCDTSECKLIANVLKESMDKKVDPCDDFYEYACGRWSNKNPLPENRTEWSLWVMVSETIEKQVQSIIETKAEPNDLFAVKLAKKWYESCIDTDTIEQRGVEPILSTLWRHGGWPLIMEEGEWDERIYHWQIVDDHFARLIGLNALHDVRYSSITYGGNDTILIDTPHLPLGLHMLLPMDVIRHMDSSDENNESGEGSQEPGSRERGQEQQNENEGGENSKEEEEENEMVKRRNHKRFGHRRKLDGHVVRKGTKRRTKRDVMKHKILHGMLHRLEKANRHITKSSKHGHLSTTANGKKHIEGTGKSRGKVVREENTKRSRHTKRKVNKNKATERRVNEQNSKKTSKVHNNGHHTKRRVSNHKVYHTMNKATLTKHRKAVDTESTDNDMGSDSKIENDNDSGIDSDKENSNDESKDISNNDAENEENEEDTNDKDNDDSEQEDDEADNGNEESEEKNTEENDDKEDDEDIDEETAREQLKEAYKEYILNVSLVLSKARGIEIPKETLMKDINDLLEFSMKLGELIMKDGEYVNTTLREFQESYDSMPYTTRNSKINWVKKVQKIFAEAGVDIEDDVEITVINPDYIRELHSLLDKTPSKTIVNYIHWLFISMAVMAGPREVREMAEEWLPGFKFPSRESECIELVDISGIVAYQYVQQYLSEDTAKMARDMIDDIQKEVEYQIKESTWMDEDTKHFILDKLVNMKNLVGYPNWYKNTTMVQRYFQGLTIGPSYYENLLNYIRHLRWKRLRRIVEETDEPAEYLDPLMLNAFFVPTENFIAISAADLQSPFFALNRPWSVNFGIIGLVMAHEVNHGFDDSGHLYDHSGNFMEWLSAMAEAYDKRAECFVDQFNKYSIISGENYTIENYGNQTAGENIADTMGLQAVFRAYKRRERECGKPDPALPGLEKFSNEQIFFLSFANLWCETVDREDLIRSAKYDVHSPGRLRVIGSVSNSDDFAKAFNCPAGSPMNPKRKCNIWN